MKKEKNTVEEIMVPLEDYNTISENATIYEAIRILRESFHREGGAWHGHRSVIVKNSSGEPSGILTLGSILRAAGLKDLCLDDPYLKSLSWGWYYIKKLQEGTIRVRDIMQPLGLAAVRAADSITGAARTLLRHNVNSAPVIKKGKVVGILRTIDIFLAMDKYFS
ncbi:MAG: cyclic nucleotide-binding/CBS domain-containing protein [Desulfotomaculales bacterium]|jgi:CBS domain-containing protein